MSEAIEFDPSVRTLSPLSPSDKLRQKLRSQTMRRGAVPTQGALTENATHSDRLESVGQIGQIPQQASEGISADKIQSAQMADAPKPDQNNPAERLRIRLAQEQQAAQSRKAVLHDLATMKTLTKLLESVYARPGSKASEAERIAALSILASNASELGAVISTIAGKDPQKSDYARAMGMDAAVGLVSKAWSEGRDVDWRGIIDASLQSPTIMQAAQELSKQGYLPVQTQQDAQTRILVSMHSAFWRVYSLGDQVNGMTPKLAAEIVQNCANYLQGRDRFIQDNDLHTSWLQGSLGRMTDLVCAEMRAQFTGAQTPSEQDIKNVLLTARAGFEGVENYAQSILEVSASRPEQHPIG